MVDNFRIKDAFQMREHHQELLMKNRSYVLHNLCPTETFWSALLELGVLDVNMLEDIKSQQTRTEKVTALLDLLPHRGPEAFDDFLGALLKCGHGFVADYLKFLEVSDQFKMDIKAYNISDHIQDRLLRTYKKSLPSVQRFFETKLEVNMQEQDTEFQEKEQELKDLEKEIDSLHGRAAESRRWFDGCVDRCMALGAEVKRPYVSRACLREERRCLEELSEKEAAQEWHGGRVSRLCDGLHAIIDYIEMSEDRRAALEHRLNCGDDDADEAAPDGATGLADKNIGGKTITAKVQTVMDQITTVMEKTALSSARSTPQEEGEGFDVRSQLEKPIGQLRDIIKDLTYVKRIFMTTLRKKEELSQETLSLVHNFREIRRLEREMNEKQDHIQELRKRGQTIKTKSKRHKRYVEQIQEEIEQKERQLGELSDHLQKQVSSADTRVHFILSLLPDSGEQQGPNALADDLRSESGMSTLSRDLTYISVLRDRSDTRFSLTSTKNEREHTDIKPSEGTNSKPTVTTTTTITTATATNATTTTSSVTSGNRQSTPAVTETRVAPCKIKNNPDHSADKGHLLNRHGKQHTEGSLSVQNKSTAHSAKETDRSKTMDPDAQMSSPRQAKSSTSSGSQGRKSAGVRISFLSQNKVKPLTPGPEHTRTSNTPRKPDDTSKSTSGPEEKKEPERRLAIGSVTSGVGLEKPITPCDANKVESRPVTRPGTEGKEAHLPGNIIKVKPADAPKEGTKSNETHEIKANGQIAQLRNHYPRQGTSTDRSFSYTPRHAGGRNHASDSRSNNNNEPLSISASRSMSILQAVSDEKSQWSVAKSSTSIATDKSVPRTPITTTPGSVSKQSTSATTERPIPNTRAVRMNSVDEKELKSAVASSSGQRAAVSARPSISTGNNSTKAPAVSSRQLLKPHGNEGDSLNATLSLTYPPNKKQSRAKTGDQSTPVNGKVEGKELTSVEQSQRREVDGSKKVTDDGKPDNKDWSYPGRPPSERRQSANHKASISTDSGGDVGSSSCSDDCNLNPEGRAAGGTNKTNNSVWWDPELDEVGPRGMPRTPSAVSMSKLISRQQSEDPNKYPQRQVLTAKKVELK